MTRRRKIVYAALAMTFVICAGCLGWTIGVGSVSEANYQRIQPGMSLAEVERLMGGPGQEIPEAHVGRYMMFDGVPSGMPGKETRLVNGDRYFRWQQSFILPFVSWTNTIYVSFRGDLVAEKHFDRPSM